ncbi:Protein disulfide-isomerase [Psilocybe cubensis]|uniref:Protein disulfide-isomerase n=2 Tax=Psilocybe cubensis TaxID=181762 RepID=A0ACB8H6K9_PSICU|nr:Protein disulfide-isomerase [Psilocybe cubensis]KAH9483359.1 Protein disulfide-isomerase [Psilocybe cubensis]
MWCSMPALLMAYAALVVANKAASDVIDLTPATFESIVQEEPLLLVAFVAPSMSYHCVRLAPHYEQAATALKERGIKVAKVDCVREADFCQSEGIQVYPVLKVYRHGEATTYTGPRKSYHIVDYMIHQHYRTVFDVTAENHDAFTKSDKVVVIAYLSSTTDDLALEFREASFALRNDYLFGMATDKAAIEAASVTAPSIVVYRSFDEPRLEYPYPIYSLSMNDLVEWVSGLAIPVFANDDGSDYAVFLRSGKPLAILFVGPSPTADKEAQISGIAPIAAKYKSKMNFVWSDASIFGSHPDVHYPVFVIHNVGRQSKYPLAPQKVQGVTPERAIELVERYLGGKRGRPLKDQPVPDLQEEPVLTVFDNFSLAKINSDYSKDIFIHFYNIRSRESMLLEPIWDNLGKKYAAIKDRIVIARMDSLEHGLPLFTPFRMTTLPTLMFRSAGTHGFIEYDSTNYAFENLVSFVEMHAKNPLDLPEVSDSQDAQAPFSVGS